MKFTKHTVIFRSTLLFQKCTTGKLIHTKVHSYNESFYTKAIQEQAPVQNDSMFREGSILLEYLPKLIRLAEKNMSSRVQQKIGADDMADSIVASIIRAQRNGKLKVDIEESQDFWRYLVAVSLNKIRKKVRLLNAEKRNLDIEVPLENIEFLVQQQGDPSDEGGHVVALLLERLEQELDEDKLLVLNGKLEGQAAEEIAERLNGGAGMSTKTVGRHWKAIETRLKELIKELDLD